MKYDTSTEEKRGVHEVVLSSLTLRESIELLFEILMSTYHITKQITILRVFK